MARTSTSAVPLELSERRVVEVMCTAVSLWAALRFSSQTQYSFSKTKYWINL
jgi:hypothetical protein